MAAPPVLRHRCSISINYLAPLPLGFGFDVGLHGKYEQIQKPPLYSGLMLIFGEARRDGNSTALRDIGGQQCVYVCVCVWRELNFRITRRKSLSILVACFPDLLPEQTALRAERKSAERGNCPVVRR